MKLRVVFLRAVMGLFWVSIIVIFLCLPLFKSFVSTEKSINIMSWTELIDPQVIKQFEQQTGIKVHVSYYESNEELYARIKATGGTGFDMLIPSDYIMPLLLQDSLLKPLDKEKITGWDRVDPRLLDHYFDPDNIHSIPYVWQLSGLAVDMRAFNYHMPEATWGLLFDKTLVPGCVVMPDVAREVIQIAALYLFGTTDNIDEKKLEKIYLLLYEQKQWVAAYSEMRADFLLTTGVCPVIVSQSPLMWKVTREYEHIQFVIPKEGTFAVIDSLVIPKASCKEEYVYQFINFLYQPHIIKHHFEIYRIIPTTSDILDLMNQVSGGQSVKDALAQITHDMNFFRLIIDEKKIKDIWVALKGL